MLIEGVFWSQTIVVAVFNSFSTIYSSSALHCSSVVKRTERSFPMSDSGNVAWMGAV